MAAVSDTTTIRVTASGRAEAPPDVVQVHLVCTAEDDGAVAAFEQCSSVATAVIGALRGLGLSDGDISTAGIDLSRHRRDGDSGRDRYVATNSFMVTAAPPERAGELLQVALEAGGDNLTIGRLRFALDNPEPAVGRARAAAVQTARRTAEELAIAAGSRLARLVSLEEGPGRPNVLSGPFAAAARSAPVEIADQAVVITVSAVFEAGAPTS